MKGQCDIQPERFVETQGKIQFRFNIKFIEVVNTEDSNMDASHSHWEYDFVNIPDKNRGALIDAVISDRYSYDRQIGKVAQVNDSSEKIAYLEFVQGVKDMVDLALSE